jgi:hypothetical protein
MHQGIYEENLNAETGVARVAVPPQHHPTSPVTLLKHPPTSVDSAHTPNFSKVLDSICYGLLAKLRYYGSRVPLASLLESHSNECSQSAVRNNLTADILQILHGVPQGSTLVLLLYRIYTTDGTTDISTKEW